MTTPHNMRNTRHHDNRRNGGARSQQRPINRTNGATNGQHGERDAAGRTGRYRPLHEQNGATGQFRPPSGSLGNTGQHRPPSGSLGSTGQFRPPSGSLGNTGQHRPVRRTNGNTGNLRSARMQNGATGQHRPLRDQNGSTGQLRRNPQGTGSIGNRRPLPRGYKARTRRPNNLNIIVASVAVVLVAFTFLLGKSCQSTADTDKGSSQGTTAAAQTSTNPKSAENNTVKDRPSDKAANKSGRTLTVNGNEACSIEESVIAGWTSSSNGGTKVNEDKVYNWVEKTLTPVLNTAEGKRTYARADGKEITVTGGDYGWILDTEGIADQLVEDLENGSELDVEAPVLQSAEVWNPGGQDWGKRYIDVDLSEQHVRLYDETGSLAWECDCVTGDPVKERETPEGVYQLNDNKESGEVCLEGPINDFTDQPEYVTYITYWMPFIDNLIAIHDAPWRYTFGGEVYRNNGSHGCVNISEDHAAQLFDLSRVGDVVVVHH